MFVSTDVTTHLEVELNHEISSLTTKLPISLLTPGYEALTQRVLVSTDVTAHLEVELNHEISSLTTTLTYFFVNSRL